VTEFEALALQAALSVLRAAEPAIAAAVSDLVQSIVGKRPLTHAIKHLQAVVDAKALGLDPTKV